MKILALDTSGPVAGAALMENGVVTHEIIAQHGLTHSQTAMPMVDQCLESAGVAAKDVDLFAAVAGPGSFTGVRIGVCAVRALAHAWGKNALALDSLETLAINAFGFSGVICPILDARRGQVYCAAFRLESGETPTRLLEDDALSLQEFLEKLPPTEKCLFLGDGLTAHFPSIRQTLGERAVAAPAHMAYLRPAAACRLAQIRSDQAQDCLHLKPVYLRAPQAERERNARLAKEAAHV